MNETLNGDPISSTTNGFTDAARTKFELSGDINYASGKRKSNSFKGNYNKPQRILSRAEYEQLISHPRFTPVHRLILDDRIEKGEWQIE